MKIKKQWLVAIFVFILLAALTVTGVLLWNRNNTGPSRTSSLSINLEMTIPPAYIREPYDLRQILRMEEGVEYSAVAYYQDYDAMQEYEIPVTDLVFCQEENFEVYVLITAKRGTETAQKSVRIPLEIRADVMDGLMQSSGLAGWSDDVIKMLNTDPQYLKGEGSQTSLLASFNGMNDDRWGAIFLSFAGEYVYPHLTDQVWSNAVVTFWAYNPMPEPFEFQIYYADSITQVWSDWSDEKSDGVVRCYAEPGQWTQILLPLRKLGITRPFNSVKDTLAVRIRYGGHPGTETAYSYHLYVDGMDVVDGSNFPDLDTRPVKSPEDISLGWENISVASSNSHDVYYDTDIYYPEESMCSLYAAFKKQGSEFWPSVTLEPYVDARFTGKLPDLTSGTITTYFRFKNLVPEVRMKLAAEGLDEWVRSQYVPMTLEPAGNDWYKGTINVSDFEFAKNRNDQIVSIEFEFPHAKDGSEVWIDRMLFTPSDAGKPTESPSADWINIPVDNNWYSGLYKYSTSRMKGNDSKRSVELIAPENQEGQIVFDFKAGVKYGKISSLPGMTKGTLEAYFYFGDQEPMATAFVYNGQEQYADANFYFESVGDGWYRGTITAEQMSNSGQFDTGKLLCLGIRVPAGYTVYIDTLTLDANRNLEWTFNPDDLFNTGAVSVTGVKQGVAGYRVVTDETNGSADALYFWTNAKADWPMVHVSFPTPVDLSAYTNLRLDGKLGYGHNWVGIGVNYLDENGDIQHSGNYVNLTGEGWDSFKFSFTQFAGVNWSQVTSITVGINQCDFVEGAVNEHWLDNLCVYTEAQDPNDLFSDAALEWGAFHKAADNAGIEGYSYDSASTEVFGEESVRSWKFTIEAGKGGHNGTAQLKLAAPVDATGKKLVFDLKLVDFRNWFGVSFADSSWQEIGYWASEMENTTEWQTVTVDLSQMTGGDLSKLYLITLHMADESAVAYDQVLYVDNVRLLDADEPAEPTEPIEPTVPTVPTEPDSDQNDLFSGAALEWGAFHQNPDNAGLDGYSYDSASTEVFGEESARSWKFTIEAGKGGHNGTAQLKLATPVNATGKKLVFDLKLVDFRNWFGVSFADSSWQEIGYWASEMENTTDWQTVTVDLSQMTGGDLSKVYLITLHMADESAVAYDQVLYVDNVRLLDADEPAEPTEPIEPTVPTVPTEPDSDQNDLFSGAALEWGAFHQNPDNAGLDGYSYDSASTEVFGEESVRSWKFTIEAGKGGHNGTAQLKLATPVNATGKKLVFDLKLVDFRNWFGVSFADSGWQEIGYWASEMENTTEWQTVTVDLSQMTGGDLSKLYLITLHMADESAVAYDQVLYVDNVRLLDADAPAVPTEPTEPTETTEPTEPDSDQNDLFSGAALEWGAFHQNPDNAGLDGYSYDSASTEVFGEESVRSWKFTIEAGKGGHSGTAQLKLAAPVNATGKKLVFDLKLVDFRNWFGVSFADSGWQEIGYWASEVEDTTEWQTVTVDLSQMTGGDLSKLYLITLHTDDESVKAYDQVLYVDNVRLEDTDEPTEPTEPEITEPETTEPETTEPTEPAIDQNDLFSGAALEWGAFHQNPDNAGLDGYSYDSASTEVFGEESARSWKFTIEAGKGGHHGTAQLKLAEPVDATGKKLVFDLKLVDFRNWIGLSLADSGWQDIGYLGSDLQDTADWQTVTVDLSQMTGGDLSKLYLITLHMADESAVAYDQVLYVDNVRLVDADEPAEPTEPEITEPETTEPTEPETTEPTKPDSDQNDLFSDAALEWGAFHQNTDNGGKDGYSSEVCTDTVNGDSSIQSWKFTIEAGKGGHHGTAQLKLAAPVDATGKKLVFDLKLVDFRNWIGLSLADSGWQDIGYLGSDLQDTADWQTVTVDLSQMTGGDLSKLYLITLHMADESAVAYDQVLYVDNVRLVDADEPAEPTEPEITEPETTEPTGPASDQNDLFSDAALEWGAFHQDSGHAGVEGYSYDSASTEVFGEGSIHSWKFTIEAGKGGHSGTAQLKLAEPVDATGKKLVFDLKLVDFRNWIGLSLADSGWQDIGYLGCDLQDTADWQTVTVDLSQMTGGDLSRLYLITLHMADESAVAYDQVLYVDNVRLVDPNGNISQTVEVTDAVTLTSIGSDYTAEHKTVDGDNNVIAFTAAASTVSDWPAMVAALPVDVSLGKHYLKFDILTASAFKDLYLTVLDENGNRIIRDLFIMGLGEAVGQWQSFTVNMLTQGLTQEQIDRIAAIRFAFYVDPSAANAGDTLYVDNLKLS